MKQILSVILLVPILWGCTGLPLAERQNNATTEVSEKWSRNQKESIKVAIGAAAQTQQPSTVEWTSDNTESGNGDQSLATQLEQSIPGGLKMLYAALGIGALVWAFGMLRRSSATANAAIGAADRGLANAINAIEARIHTAANAEERAMHIASLAALEKARGQANRKK